MREYRVTLKEYSNEKFTIVFDCWAEDPDHADEQALNAYPLATVINATAKEVNE